jgi:hypothetical protein
MVAAAYQVQQPATYNLRTVPWCDWQDRHPTELRRGYPILWSPRQHTSRLAFSAPLNREYHSCSWSRVQIHFLTGGKKRGHRK